MEVVLENVGVTYPTLSGASLVAVKDVSARIGSGEFVALIGPSGCGKSTLLHCIGGLRQPTSGQVLFGDSAIRGCDPSTAAFVFQDYALFPWKTVAENAALGLKFRGVGRSERRQRALENLELVGLRDFADAYPNELSGGMQQRVSVARAMVMEPKVLLLDEPFGAVDELTRRRLGVEMSRILTAAGQTTIMVTHSLDEAIFWSDRIFVMSAGPGQIVRELEVQSARPRPEEFLISEDFSRLRTELLSILTNGQDLLLSVAEKELSEHE